MANRRDFLKMSALLTAGTLAGSQVLTSCGGGSKKPQAPTKSIGVQLYSVREPIADLGIQEVLTQLSKIGYKTLELASYNDSNGTMYGLQPEELKKMVEDLGMKITSSHVGGGEMFPMEYWKKAADDHARCGCKYLVVPIYRFDPENQLGLQEKTDQIKAFCEYLEQVGMTIVTGGMVKVGFHNHWYEFEKIKEGETDELIYDYMLSNTSASHVFFENDTFWTQYTGDIAPTGTNSVNFINKYPGRFPLMHMKDEYEIGQSGLIDFQPIFDACYANGMKEYFIEVENYNNDQNKDPMIGIKQSYDFFANADYVK
ncbi:MAG: TIM barrel protein [Bacteroidales bacterium]|nr:TIM barrel protein [Bacteroidales bacterium]